MFESTPLFVEVFERGGANDWIHDSGEAVVITSFVDQEGGCGHVILVNGELEDEDMIESFLDAADVVLRDEAARR